MLRFFRNDRITVDAVRLKMSGGRRTKCLENEPEFAIFVTIEPLTHTRFRLFSLSTYVFLPCRETPYLAENLIASAACTEKEVLNPKQSRL